MCPLGEVSAAGMLPSSLHGWIQGVLAKRVHHRPRTSGVQYDRVDKTGDGFTLLEVLVAVVIMAVIMTTAFGALRLGGRSWEAGVTRASDNERFRAVADLMRRQVSQIIPMTWPDGTKKRIAFEGASDQLRFVSPAPQQHRQAGLFEYGLSAQRDGPDTNLILSFIPFNPDSEAFQRPAQRSTAAAGSGAAACVI